MKLETSLKQTQIQTQKLSLKQQYSLKVLEMNDTQMLDAIVSELEINPVLEANENIYAMQERAYGDRTPYELALNYVEQEETLSDILLSQLHMDRRAVNEVLASFIIESLDSNGYLQMSVEELTKITHFSNDEIEQTIQIIQSYEPHGVCARTLKECILLQLADKKSVFCLLAEDITEHYLNELAENKLPLIASQLHCTLEDVNEAVALIRSCHPKPGAMYATSASYASPDVRISVENQEVHIELLSTRYDVRISTRYQETKDSAIKKYLAKHMKQAELLIASIEKRNVTLLGIVQCIVEHQKQYCLNNQQLQPLTLKEIGDELGLHESTISRTVSNKYMEFHQKMIPLKFFFPTKLSSGDSSSAIQDMMKSLIDSEDKKRPYSDQEISDLLAAKGMKVSRRTVAKYRDILGIANTTKRKVY